MKVYNTKTKKKEPFHPISLEKVKFYYCGPTVYNYSHIGNLKTYTFEDIIIKTLKFLGYNLKTVMNITDVDDKTIRDSMRAGESLDKFTKKYTHYFLEDIEKLGIKKADEIVPVSTLIPEMVRMIQTMLNRKNAYLGEDLSIYFNIKSFKKYGQLANLDISGMKTSVRIDNDEYTKDCASDFALWKAWKKEDGDNFWEEEFEVYIDNFKTLPSKLKNLKKQKVVLKGRPGWHIECSACNMKYFGPQIDIHMGGIDNLFPHHQNELAQSEVCTGKEFSKYWFHLGHLTVNGKKMAKSEKNFYTLRDLEDKFKSSVGESILYRSIRLGFINGKYRENTDFSFEKLESNFQVIKHIDETFKNIFYYETHKKGISLSFRKKMQYFVKKYVGFLEDDFNIVESLVIFHEFLKFINIGVVENDFLLEEKGACIDLLHTFNDVLGIVDFSIVGMQSFSQEIIDLFEKRNQLKKEKNFLKADMLRVELESLGFRIIDNREGSRLERDT